MAEELLAEERELYEALRRKADELSTLFNISKIITGSLNLEEVLKQVVEEASHLMNTKICSLMLLNDEETELAIKAVHGGSSDYVQKPPLRVEESLVGQVVKNKKPLIVLDVLKERGYKHLDLARREGLCSLLSVPLMVKGKVIGVINTYKSTQHEFTEEEVQLLSSLADQSAIAIENARLYERMIALEEEIRRVEKLGVLGELAMEVAHEIRNPLTIIKMLLYTLPTGDRKDLTIVEDEIDRINRIITQFLEYARSKGPQRQEVDINQVLDHNLSLVSHRLSRQRIRLAQEIDPSLPRLMGDPDKMGQAFLNLILNAVEAMPGGGTLLVLTRKTGQFIQVQITDSGPGISPAIKDRIFLPFVTTKEGGLGLGLSIVRRIIEEHKGNILVDTQEGHGTTFTIKLPLDRGGDRRDG